MQIQHLFRPLFTFSAYFRKTGLSIQKKTFPDNLKAELIIWQAHCQNLFHPFPALTDGHKKGRILRRRQSAKKNPPPLIYRVISPSCYQMETRSACGTNIGSFSVTPKASYQAPMCGSAPFTRHSPSECTSILVSCSTYSGRMLLAHTPA